MLGYNTGGNVFFTFLMHFYLVTRLRVIVEGTVFVSSILLHFMLIVFNMLQFLVFVMSVLVRTLLGGAHDKLMRSMLMTTQRVKRRLLSYNVRNESRTKT